MKKNKQIVSYVTVFLLLIAIIFFLAAKYISDNFPNQNIDEMIFYLFNGMKGTSIDVFLSAINTTIVPLFILFFLLYIPIIRLEKRKNIIEVKFRNRKISFTILPLELFYKYRLIYASFILVLSLIASYNLLGVANYIKRLNDYSSLIEDYYVSGKDVSTKFPSEKRNLIILYLESVENSLINKENGGGWEYSLIPELEKIALENINFSNSDKIGGAYPINGTGWTVAGLVATTAGIPLKIPIDGNSYTSSDNFLSGAITLGDILEEEGYNLEFMVGSDARFGGRSNYYTKHGNYKIFDLLTAIKEGKMSHSEQVWWGYDDTHLFKWAKEEITELAKLKEPFSFSFLTVNTHATDGYLESGADQIFDSQYENVYAYSSKQVAEFLFWLQQQEYYKNTTVVIVGDHLSMQKPEFFDSHIYSGYERTIYNAFINSPTKPNNSKNRKFTSLDIYPTILASIGVEIEGNRLGLGTNLYSERKTLVEDFPISYVEEELEKNSHFYNRHILQDDYLELLTKDKKR